MPAIYLTARGLPFTTVTYGPDAIRMLMRGEVQAVVFDAATLQYWAGKEGKGVVQVVGWDLRENLLGVVRRRAVKLLRDPLGDHKVSTRATRMTSHEPGPVSLRVIDVLMYTPSSRIAFTRYPVKRTV